MRDITGKPNQIPPPEPTYIEVTRDVYFGYGKRISRLPYLISYVSITVFVSLVAQYKNCFLILQ